MKNAVSRATLLQAMTNVGPPEVLPADKVKERLIPLKTEFRLMLNKHWSELWKTGLIRSADNASSRNGSVAYDRAHTVDFFIKKAEEEGKDRVANAIPGILLTLLSSLMREKGYGRRDLALAYRNEAARLNAPQLETPATEEEAA